jgi:hypothetical protein
MPIDFSGPGDRFASLTSIVPMAVLLKSQWPPIVLHRQLVSFRVFLALFTDSAWPDALAFSLDDRDKVTCAKILVSDTYHKNS